jgi:hypothetical protein
VQISAGLGLAFVRRRWMKHLRKQLAERCGIGSSRREREVKTSELESAARRSLTMRTGRPSRGVVFLPSRRVAQRLIRFGDPLKNSFGLVIARVHARMIQP